MAGWIILAIIFVIAMFLHISLHIFVSYNENGLTITADYLGIKLYPRPKKEGEKGKKKKSGIIQKIKNKLKGKKKKISDIPDDDDYDFDNLDDIDEEIEKFEKEEIKKEIIIDDTEITASLENIEKKKQEEKLLDEPEEKEAETISDKSEPIEKIDQETEQQPKKEADKEPNIIEKLQDKYNKIKQKYLVHIPYLWEKLKKTLKAIRIYNIEFEIDSGRLDASESAMFYGHLNSAVFSLFGALAGIFTMQFQKAQINLKFNEEIFKVRTKFDIYLRPSTFLWILACVGGYFVKEKYLKKFANKIKAKFCKSC